LEKPWAQYDKNSGELYNWLKGPTGPLFPKPTGNIQARKCEGTLGCYFGTTRTQLDYGPSEDAIKLDVTNPPANGAVVAWMEQKGKFVEKPYKVPIEPGIVIVVVEPNGAGKAKWTTLHVTSSGFKFLKSGKYRDCGKPHDDKSSRAGFGGCPKSVEAAAKLHAALQAMDAATTPERRAAAQAEVQALLGNWETDDLWVSCVQGCCIAET
jgi:hypothetical protein